MFFHQTVIKLVLWCGISQDASFPLWPPISVCFRLSFISWRHDSHSEWGPPELSPEGALYGHRVLSELTESSPANLSLLPWPRSLSTNTETGNRESDIWENTPLLLLWFDFNVVFFCYRVGDFFLYPEKIFAIWFHILFTVSVFLVKSMYLSKIQIFWSCYRNPRVLQTGRCGANYVRHV